MRTSIALLALLLAAALRPGPAFPEVRRPAPAAVDVLPAETVPKPAPRPGFLDALAGALRPAEEVDPLLIKKRVYLGIPRHATDDDGDIIAPRRKLATMRIDLAFEDTALEDILVFIRDFSGLNLILDAAVRDRIDPDRPVTFKVKDIVLGGALKLLLRPRGLTYVVTEEDVVLITEFRNHPAERARQKLDTLRVALDFEEATAEEILGVIQDVADLDLLIDADAREGALKERRLRFKVGDLRLHAALRLLLQPLQLDYRVLEQGIVFVTGCDRGLHRDVDGMPFALDERDPDRY